MTARPRRLIVALDGPASSGKSSVGAAAAAELGYRFCDTGLLYRAVTWLAMRRAVGDDDPARLAALVGAVELIGDDRGRLSRVSVEGEDVTDAVRGPEVDGRVSAISRVPELRAALLARQRDLAADGGIIMAGRDIGTVVLPDADLKLYLEASAEERAARRVAERGLGPTGRAARRILADLRKRDALDMNRPVAPLRPADDARIVRTDGNTFQQTVDAVVGEIQERAKAVTAPTVVLATPAGAPDASPRTGPERGEPPMSRPPRADLVPIDGRTSWLIHLCAWIARALARAITRIRIDGDPAIIPREGPVILAANHASNLDPVIVGGFLTPTTGRRLHWLGKRELFEWPVLGWIARDTGIHPVDRGTADVDAYRVAKRILDEGHILVVFPEGTRSPTGALQEAKDGVAVLAMKTGAQIVPLGVTDSDRVWPRRWKIPHPGGRVTLRIGVPFRLDAATMAGAADRDRRAAKGRATGVLMRRIAALLPPRQRGVYADPEA